MKKTLLAIAISLVLTACITAEQNVYYTNGLFVGEDIKSGIPAWDEAFIKAGGKFK